ncbi:MAG TPA: hypothetical protein EYP29_04735 [Thermoplasmata archaeon]|nr:hypothetical protein [Thermoplasmata archaeon]
MSQRNGTTKNEFKKVFAEMKIPNGKMLECEISFKKEPSSQLILSEIRFSGDFFLHPEERIEEIEEKLSKVDPERLVEETLLLFQSKELELVGASPEDFASVVEKCVKKMS